MNHDSRTKLAARVANAAEEALARQDHVSAMDVLVGIGWLASSHMQRWRTGQLEFLESAIQVNPSRLSEAMHQLEAWASARGLIAGETEYIARTPGRELLRFSQSGDPSTERAYRTRWLAPEIPQQKRKRLEEKASEPPALVVIQPRGDWACHRCGGSGGFLIMEKPGPSCLRCAGLDRLEFLPSGDAALTRRAKAKSQVHAVVVRFSRTRGRYERQGLLVEPEALRAAEIELGAGLRKG